MKETCRNRKSYYSMNSSYNMAVILKGIICGDKKVGKTSFLEQLSGGESENNCYDIELTDPATKSQIKFIIEETSVIPQTKSVCIFLVYSLASVSSFESIKRKWFPNIQSTTNLSSSFVIIIGTHSDITEKSVKSHEAEEFAASNGAFHMEVSSVSKRNIELTLKLMRIRAFYLLRKHPELKSDNKSVLESPRSTGELNTCQSFSTDIPLPFKDFNNIQSKRHRYEEEKKSFAENVLESSGEKCKNTMSIFKEERNISFADMGESDEIPNLSDEFSDEKMQEISIDTLGSPSWHQQKKVPPLSILHMTPENSFPQTERSFEASSRFLESGSSTERNDKEPLMILEVKLQKGLKKIEVFAGDSSQTLAERVLGYNTEGKELLSDAIEKAINEYIAQVRSVSLKKPLFKVKIAIGNGWGEIVVHEGDSLEDVSREFIEENNLSKQYEKQIFRLLFEAGEKYYS